MFIKRILLALVALVALSLAAINIAVRVRSRLTEFEGYFASGMPADTAGGRSQLRVTFLGVMTLLFDDGETAILTDGFFTRPNLFKVAVTRVAPDSSLIARAMARAGITRLAAVIPVHSHYDHAMDAPFVAKWTGAELLGSASTANVGRGAGLPEQQIITAAPGETRTYGRFSVTLLPSRHVPSPTPMAGTIDAPLKPPARAKDYRVGEAWTIVIRHDGRTILVQGSAGFIPAALKDIKADVIYLGVGILGKQTPEYRDSLWREVVEPTGAKRVFVVHWDDFWRSLDKPLVPLPRLVDNFDVTMRFLLSHAGPGAPEIRIPEVFAPMSPFAGLGPP